LNRVEQGVAFRLNRDRTGPSAAFCSESMPATPLPGAFESAASRLVRRIAVFMRGGVPAKKRAKPEPG
jgi:hypothetical protein